MPSLSRGTAAAAVVLAAATVLGTSGCVDHTTVDRQQFTLLSGKANALRLAGLGTVVARYQSGSTSSPDEPTVTTVIEGQGDKYQLLSAVEGRLESAGYQMNGPCENRVDVCWWVLPVDGETEVSVILTPFGPGNRWGDKDHPERPSGTVLAGYSAVSIRVSKL